MVTVSGDILGQFRRELLAEVETIRIADCEALNLSNEARVGLDEARNAFDNDGGVELTIENVTSVDLRLVHLTSDTRTTVYKGHLEFFDVIAPLYTQEGRDDRLVRML